MASTRLETSGPRMTRKCLVLSYRRVIALCLLILTNAPGISPGCTSVAPVCHLVSPGPGSEKSRLCLSPVSPPRVYNELYTFMRMVKLELKKSKSRLL